MSRKEASAARRRFSIETELRRALDKDQLKLFYQPLIDLKSGEVAGFEALARWSHEDRGEISPTEFIPVAEESGLILHARPLGDGQGRARRWPNGTAQAGEPLPVYVGVNLSRDPGRARQYRRGGRRARSSRAGSTGDRLTLELTESSIVQDPARAIRVFEALKALDATVAMDDFGTGYSSLAYLQRLPIDVLKIDRSFVTGMMVDPDSVAIVRAVLSLADALGMSTTAEGIETVELATTLATLGCASRPGLLFRQAARARSGAGLFGARRSAERWPISALASSSATMRSNSLPSAETRLRPQRSSIGAACGRRSGLPSTPRAISRRRRSAGAAARQSRSAMRLSPGSPASSSRSTAHSVPMR